MIYDVKKLFRSNDPKRSCALSGITGLEIKKNPHVAFDQL